MHNQISFKANYISAATIQQRTPQFTFTDKKVSFVQLDPESTLDRNSIFTLDHNWEHRKTFANEIFEDMNDCTDFYNHAGKKFFALTTQKNHFEILESEKILGITEIINGMRDTLKLKYLQVHPQHKWTSEAAAFKHIGSAILDSLKRHFPACDIILESVPDAKNFYRANGFKQFSREHFIFKRLF